MRAAFLLLLIAARTASAQVHHTVYDELRSHERAVRFSAHGALSGNALNITQIVAAARIAQDFSAADAFLLGDLAPADDAFLVGSQSDGRIAVMIPRASYTLGVSASGNLLAGAYVPPSVTALLNEGSRDSVLHVNLDGLRATSFMRSEVGLHVLQNRAQHALGFGVRFARDVPLADIEFHAMTPAGAIVDVGAGGVTSSFAMSGSRRRSAVFADAHYERQAGKRLGVRASVLGFGAARTTHHTAQRPIEASALSLNEFMALLDTARADGGPAATATAIATPRVVLAARYDFDRFSVHASAGKPYDGAPVSTVQLRVDRRFSFVDLEAGTLVTRYGVGWTGGAAARLGAMRFSMRAAGDGGLRLEHGRNLTVSTAVGVAF